MPEKSSVRCTAQISSCSSGGNIWAGSPTATQPIGSSAPAGRVLLTCSTPLMRTSAPVTYARAGKQRGAGRDERLVADVGAVDVGVWADEHAVAEHDGVPGPPA